jgi:hypothetical protein
MGTLYQSLEGVEMTVVRDMARVMMQEGKEMVKEA